MTEYEAASLALQHTALWAAVAGPLVALIVGGAQVGIVGWGIRAMIREGTKRDEQHERRHAEAMRALESLIKGMEEGFRQQGEALNTVIERTGGRA